MDIRIITQGGVLGNRGHHDGGGAPRAYRTG